MRPGYLQQVSIKQPRQLRARAFSGFSGGGTFNCFGSQCPPPSKYNLLPQFYPGIEELQSAGSGDAQEAAAKNINAGIRASLQKAITALQGAGNQESAQQIQDIFNDLTALDTWIKGVNPPYKEAPMVPPHRMAEKLASKIGAYYQNNRWNCVGSEPAQEADGFYQCCPTGWIKVGFNSSAKCPDPDLFSCGPVPPGMDRSQLVCCAKQGMWTPADPTGKDPCIVALPLNTRILAPDLIIEREPVVTPKMYMAGGAVVISLLALAFFTS